jgi:urease accessory protein UreE
MKPTDLTKKRHSDSLKKSQLTLSQGMMKKGDALAVDDDDNVEVRTSSSQN